MGYPVVLFCYKRPDHVRQTLTALAANKGAAETPLIVYSDGPAEPSEAGLVDAVRAILATAKGFGSVRIIPSKGNKGLSASVIEGVSEVLADYEACIVLEDDLETAPHFLNYMNEALMHYKDHENIFSVSGYCPPMDVPKDFPFQCFSFPRINSWGWGTWRNRWEKVDWEVQGFDQFISDKKWRAQLEQQGKDLPVMLLKQQQGKIASWAVRFNQSCFNLGMTNVYPIVSLVRNRGADGSGTHMKSSGKYSVALCNDPISPANMGSSPLIDQRFRDFYQPSCYRRLINRFKIAAYNYSRKGVHQ